MDSNPDTAPSQQPTALPIQIQSLTKKYGTFFALDSVDLDIKSGEFLTLLGPSGSGKTTLLMAIAGFNRPDAGSIRFADDEMILTPPHKRNVGMVFQSYALFPHMTVAENVAFPLKLRGVGAAESAERVAAALTTVYVTHDQREALTMSDRIVVINEGRIAQIDTPHVIYNQPANAFVADFIGESTMLPLTRNTAGHLQFDEHLISRDHADEGDCSLVIRPERLFVIGAEAIDAEQTITFTGVIRECVFQGDTAYALASINDQHALSFRFGTDSSSSQDTLQAGDPVSLGLNRSDVIIIPRGDAQ